MNQLVISLLSYLMSTSKPILLSIHSRTFFVRNKLFSFLTSQENVFLFCYFLWDLAFVCFFVYCKRYIVSLRWLLIHKSLWIPLIIVSPKQQCQFPIPYNALIFFDSFITLCLLTICYITSSIIKFRYIHPFHFLIYALKKTKKNWLLTFHGPIVILPSLGNDETARLSLQFS